MIGNAKALNEAEDALWNQIVKMNFSQKYKLIEPFCATSFSKDAVADPWKINELRNDLFHGRAIKEAQFKKKSICDESTVHDIFVAAQSTTRNLRQFEEILDASHALGDGLKDRFEQLNKKVS